MCPSLALALSPSVPLFSSWSQLFHGRLLPPFVLLFHREGREERKHSRCHIRLLLLLSSEGGKKEALSSSSFSFSSQCWKGSRQQEIPLPPSPLLSSLHFSPGIAQFSLLIIIIPRGFFFLLLLKLIYAVTYKSVCHLH